MSTPDIRKTIEAVWKMEAAKIIAALARRVRDVGVAEELAQEALVAALEQWPREGMPENGGAWLMVTAKRRAVDWIRREKMAGRKQEELARERAAGAGDAEEQMVAALDDEFGDDLLRLIFMACHPVLSAEGRAALTLRLLGGLTTEEIARAFLVPEPTIAQRIVRAKKALSEAGVEFEVPRGAELEERLSSVLEVIYLLFNEGYTATAGGDWMRPGLCEEGLRLGRILAGLMAKRAGESEVLGLVALMEIQASRLRARTGPGGEPVLLLKQDRGKWDWMLIGRGLAALARAEEIARKRHGSEYSPVAPAKGMYLLQAAIAACHARAKRAEETDWGRIAGLYGELMEVVPSPIVELNRAVAVGMAAGSGGGPGAGLEIVDGLVCAGGLKEYHLLWSVRGDFLMKLGRFAEARGEFEKAAGMTKNARERVLMRERARECEEKGR